MNRQNYSSVYLNLLNFWITNWKTNNFAANDCKRCLTSRILFVTKRPFMCTWNFEMAFYHTVVLHIKYTSSP